MNVAASDINRLGEMREALMELAAFARKVRDFRGVSLQTALCALDDIAILAEREAKEGARNG